MPSELRVFRYAFFSGMSVNCQGFTFKQAGVFQAFGAKVLAGFVTGCVFAIEVNPVQVLGGNQIT